MSSEILFVCWVILMVFPNGSICFKRSPSKCFFHVLLCFFHGFDPVSCTMLYSSRFESDGPYSARGEVLCLRGWLTKQTFLTYNIYIYILYYYMQTISWHLAFQKLVTAELYVCLLVHFAALRWFGAKRLNGCLSDCQARATALASLKRKPEACRLLANW